MLHILTQGTSDVGYFGFVDYLVLWTHNCNVMLDTLDFWILKCCIFLTQGTSDVGYFGCVDIVVSYAPDTQALCDVGYLDFLMLYIPEHNTPPLKEKFAQRKC